MKPTRAEFFLTFDTDDKAPISLKTEVVSQARLDTLGSIIRACADLKSSDYDLEYDCQSLKLVVTTGKSCYLPGKTKGLCINRDEPFVEYYKKYRAEHQPLQREERKSQSTVESTKAERYTYKNGAFAMLDWTEHTLSSGPAKLQFCRTLRVPDNANRYLLPPGLGTFPLVSANRFPGSLPEEIKARGGYIMPMFQREALWIDFEGSGACAVKVSVGGVNAITGVSRNEEGPDKQQDYLVLPQQQWLDGICTSPGEVRQFVSMKLGEGYSVEEQTMSRATHGGIQIDVFPSLQSSVRCHTPSGKAIDITRSPRELGLLNKESITMETPSLKPCVTVQDYIERIAPVIRFDVTCSYIPYRRVTVVFPSGKRIEIDWECSDEDVADVREKIGNKMGMPGDHFRLVYNGKQLEDGRTRSDYGIRKGAVIHAVMRLRGGGPGCPQLEDAKMGLAAGGKITQKIYKDARRVNIYDYEAAERVWIHTVSTELWERITGVVAPITPIVPGTYKIYDYPWFDLYDEHVPALEPSGKLKGVRSVSALDKSKLGSKSKKAPELLDPERPPQCSQHRARVAACVLRPCGHVVCEACFGKMVLGTHRCLACGEAVERLVGFQKPVPKVINGEGWWEVEEKIEGALAGSKEEKVVTLVLQDDHVSALRGVL